MHGGRPSLGLRRSKLAGRASSSRLNRRGRRLRRRSIGTGRPLIHSYVHVLRIRIRAQARARARVGNVVLVPRRKRIDKVERVPRLRDGGEGRSARGMVARRLVEPRVFGRKPVLNGDVGQDLRRGRGRRDKVRSGVRHGPLRGAELLDRRADGRRMALDAR